MTQGWFWQLGVDAGTVSAHSKTNIIGDKSTLKLWDDEMKDNYATEIVPGTNTAARER